MIIKAIDINKKYMLGKEEIHAVKNISLDINEKDFTAIIGESGSGKTSLISIIGLLLSQDSGEIYYGKKKISDINDRSISFIRKQIGFIFQNAELIPQLNLIENVMLPTLFMSIDDVKYEEYLDYTLMILKELKIMDKYKSYPNELSGGQAQRACIARALATQPDILLADEPTGELDNKTNNIIINLFKKLNSQGMTIFFVTHYERLAEVANTVYKMKNGEISLIK